MTKLHDQLKLIEGKSLSAHDYDLHYTEKLINQECLMYWKGKHIATLKTLLVKDENGKEQLTVHYDANIDIDDK